MRDAYQIPDGICLSWAESNEPSTPVVIPRPKGRRLELIEIEKLPYVEPDWARDANSMRVHRKRWRKGLHK